MLGDVALRDLERIGREVHRIDRRIGKGPRSENSETARAGAEIEHARDFCRIAELKPGVIAKMLVQDFADERARHDGPLVHIERQAAHVDLVEQIGGGFARANTLFDEIENFRAIGLGDAPACGVLDRVRVQAKRFADQECRLGDRIGRAVGEHDAGLAETTCRKADIVENCDRLVRRGGRLAGFRLFRHQGLVQRAAAASSSVFASTHALPDARSSLFQNGAAVFR